MAKSFKQSSNVYSQPIQRGALPLPWVDEDQNDRLERLDSLDRRGWLPKIRVHPVCGAETQAPSQQLVIGLEADSACDTQVFVHQDRVFYADGAVGPIAM